MGTHGATGARGRALPPGNQDAESKNINSVRRMPVMFTLSHWPVRRRLIAVIIAALVMGLVFGGLRVADAESTAGQLSQVAQLTSLGQKLTVLVNDLQNERDATVTQEGQIAPDTATLTPLYNQTDSDLPGVVAALHGIGSAFPANIQADATTALSDLSPSNVNVLHSTFGPNSPPQSEASIILNYGAVISDLLTLTGQVGQGVADSQLTSDVRALDELGLAKEQVSQQRAFLNFAFASAAAAAATAGSANPIHTYVSLSPILVSKKGPLTVTSPFFDAVDVQDLTTAYDEEFVDEAAFQQAATPAEHTFFVNALGAHTAQIATAENIEQNAIANDNQATNPQGTVTWAGSPMLDDLVQPARPSTGQGGASSIGTEPQSPVTAGMPASQIEQAGLAAWDTALGDKLNALQSTESLISGNISSRVSQLEAGAQDTALLYLLITVVVLLIVMIAALLVARSVVNPLRRLRAGALNIASVQLPERVRLLSENPESAATMEVAPINVSAQDEIGQVARAFDQVHSEAVRLAGEQAVLRSSFNAMFVNLSRRSQSLIERLARMIDTLEQNEDDPDRLGNLFSMDHLVTRMRRNSENLLLLAGHENPRKWSEPVPLADVARAATSEIEQYNRVTLNVPAGISIIGQAVSDVVHLLAELIENSTMFSPKDTQVSVTMQELASGGVLIEILDKGIGVSEARLADMNWRLDNPPTIDVSVSRHMGLFAVARLAERHRVRVRLRPANPQGLSALVWLPDSVIERVGRYGTGAMDTGTWAAQPIGAQATGGIRQVGGERSRLADSAVALAQGGGYDGAAPGNGAGNGHGNGGPPQPGRSASGWFRGGVTDSPPDSGFGGPRWGSGRNPADIVADPASSDQTIAGLPVRVPRANLIPGSATGGQPTQSGPSAPPGQTSPVSQAGLPIRGAEPGGNGMPGRGTPGPAGRPGAGGTGSQPLPQRSPEHARSRLSGFQRGTRRAESQTGQTGQPGQAPRAGEGSDR